MKNKDILMDQGFENFIIFENPDYDSAIIGITENNQVVYDYEKMIEHLMQEDDMDYEEAVDWFGGSRDDLWLRREGQLAQDDHGGDIPAL